MAAPGVKWEGGRTLAPLDIQRQNTCKGTYREQDPELKGCVGGWLVDPLPVVMLTVADSCQARGHAAAPQT